MSRLNPFKLRKNSGCFRIALCVVSVFCLCIFIFPNRTLNLRYSSTRFFDFFAFQYRIISESGFPGQHY